MINEFVKCWDARKEEVRAIFEASHPENYTAIVKAVISIMNADHDELDVDRIHAIDDGNYQGTLVFVIAAKGYQPSNYWFVKVDYGSCSVCDTLESIKNYSNEKPTSEQVNDYMTLALHIVQGLKSMQDSEN